MDGLTGLLGQDGLTDCLMEALEQSDVKLVRLTGSPGSGKSRVASAVVDRWRASDQEVIVGIGDEANAGRSLHPLLVAMTTAPYGWSALALEGGRTAANVVDGFAPSSRAATSYLIVRDLTLPRAPRVRAMKSLSRLSRGRGRDG